MPRRRQPDDEDSMRSCPQCRGKGTVRDDQDVVIECPTCQGLGRVTQPVWNRYVTKHPNWHGLLP